MARVVTRLVSPTPEMPDLLAVLGRPPGSPVPLGAIVAHLQEARQRIIASGNTEQEADGAEAYGAEHLRIVFPDTLTPAEVVAADLAAANARLAELRGLFQADGTLVPDAPAKLRKIIGV